MQAEALKKEKIIQAKEKFLQLKEEHEKEAIFRGFGSDYEEFETGAGNYSAAIVEWPNGQIELVRADRVRFVTPNARVKAAAEGSPATERSEP